EDHIEIVWVGHLSSVLITELPVGWLNRPWFGAELRSDGPGPHRLPASLPHSGTDFRTIAGSVPMVKPGRRARQRLATSLSRIRPAASGLTSTSRCMWIARPFGELRTSV